MRVSAALTDDLWRRLSPQNLETIAAIDAVQLEFERSRLKEEHRGRITTPTYSLKNRFAMWERLTYKMRHGWPPDNRYLIDEYSNDLSNRSRISTAIARLPQDLQVKLNALLQELDQQFNENTESDGGREFERWGHSRPANIPPLLWERRPIQIPWES